LRDAVDLRERPVKAAGTVLRAAAFHVEARPLSHTAPAIGYRLVEADGRRMRPDKLAAFGVTGPDIGRLQHEGRLVIGDRLVTLEQVSEPRRGQRFAFIMDTRLCDAAFELADGADMLVCESTFADAEAGARLLVLTHFSQRYEHDDVQRLAAQAATTFGGPVVPAQDLDRIPVPSRQPPAT
jgi:ribonuclease Z